MSGWNLRQSLKCSLLPVVTFALLAIGVDGVNGDTEISGDPSTNVTSPTDDRTNPFQENTSQPIKGNVASIALGSLVGILALVAAVILARRLLSSRQQSYTYSVRDDTSIQKTLDTGDAEAMQSTTFDSDKVSLSPTPRQSRNDATTDVVLPDAQCNNETVTSHVLACFDIAGWFHL